MMEMQWKNYKENIVNAHSVYLKNWPKGIPFNPDNMTSKDIKIVLRGLEGGSIEWVILSADELKG